MKMLLLTHSKISKKKRELIDALAPYSDMWEEWIESGACFLNEKELMIIRNYLSSGSFQGVSEELNITQGTAATILKKSKQRLRWSYSKYQAWMTERLLEDHQIINYSSDVDRFLNSPLAHLKISHDLKNRLSLLGKQTIQEILSSYSVKDLMRFRLIGAKVINDFEELLKENNCLHLLSNCNISKNV